MVAASHRTLVGVLAIGLLAGCHHDPAATAAAPAPPKLVPAAPLALSALAAQHIVLLPAFGLTVAPDVPVAWRAGMRPVDAELRKLDSAIATSLTDRGLNRTWIFPVDLAKDHRRNPDYVPDPYLLPEIPLLVPRLEVGNTAPVDLASQIRTFISFHEGSRFVLAPVGPRFEVVAPGSVRATLRIVILDARTGQVNWIGDVGGDAGASYSPAVLTALAERVGGLIVN